MDFPERFRLLRKENNLTQIKLAEILKISSNTLQCYEYGTHVPSIEILIQVAKVFDVSTDYLLGLSEEKKEPSSSDGTLISLVGMDDDEIKIMLALRNHFLKNKKE